jgi:hypothetical protein
MSKKLYRWSILGETLIAMLPAIFARGDRLRHLTKPYTVAAATIMRNNGALTARPTISCVNRVTAGKGVKACSTAAVATTKIT